MPIPQPKEQETQKEFVKRCMSNPKMQEYDIDQRYAICIQEYTDSKK